MPVENKVEDELIDYMKAHEVFNSHSHHLDEKMMVEMDLNKLIDNTYLQWLSIKPGVTQTSRKEYLSKVKYKSYFVWFQKALQEIYGIKEEITPQNWDTISDIIGKAHQDCDFYLKVLKEKCNYKKIVVETYWNPGYDNARPELFAPSFRIDSFLCGYKKGICDHDGIYPEKEYGELPDNLSDYIEWVRKWIQIKKNQGCVALKTAIAYERDINFERVSREKAEIVFTLNDEQKTREHVLNFQNYIFWKICEMAADLSIPIQCHTGTGQLVGTNILQLNSVIKNNPKTKFILLHCGFPWVDDIFAMLDEYPNVYPDLSWLPILSYTAAERILHQLIETSLIDKICWGCDTWTAEESYGALLAFQCTLSKVLVEKINDGYISIEDAKIIIDNILLNNGKKIYNI